MVGGGATEHGASVRRLAAKIPARRIPEVVERLIDLYAREQQRRRVGAGFFGRVELAASSRRRCADLERLTAATPCRPISSTSAEAGEFAPEVMDGECSA